MLSRIFTTVARFPRPKLLLNVSPSIFPRLRRYTSESSKNEYVSICENDRNRRNENYNA